MTFLFKHSYKVTTSFLKQYLILVESRRAPILVPGNKYIHRKIPIRRKRSIQGTRNYSGKFEPLRVGTLYTVQLFPRDRVIRYAFFSRKIVITPCQIRAGLHAVTQEYLVSFITEVLKRACLGEGMDSGNEKICLFCHCSS